MAQSKCMVFVLISISIFKSVRCGGCSVRPPIKDDSTQIGAKLESLA